MKKTLIITLVLMMTLTVLCTACGGQKNEQAAASPTTAPEATEVPSVTAPPKTEEGGETGLAAEENTAPEKQDGDAWLNSLSEEQRLVEEKLLGKPVEELYEAIGEPKSSAYTTSCVAPNAEDGILFYDGFIVTTLRYANGSELVWATDKD